MSKKTSSRVTTKTAESIADDIDALFKLPLAEFIGARKTLATGLKKEGRSDEAKHVSALPKPSISVWAVNQLYWNRRKEFEQLLAAGQRFRRAHTSRSGKAGELNEALEARREAINHLSDLASDLLRDAGHNPALDTMRRIAATLEAMSAYAVLPDDQAFGRLTKDLDPPGFESLAPFIRAVPTTRRPESAPVEAVRKSVTTVNKSHPKSAITKDAGSANDTRQAKLSSAKESLRYAKQMLAEARTKAQSVASEQKKADAAVKDAEKEKREAERRFKEASAVSVAATVRAQNLAREVARASKAVDDAERTVEKSAKEIELLFRD